MEKLLFKDYVVIDLECGLSNHPDLTIYIPASKKIPHVIKNNICPCCLSTKHVITKIYEGVYELTITDTPCDLWSHWKRSWDGQAQGRVIYSLKCVGDEKLSFIKAKNVSWKDDIELKICPVCGSDLTASDLKKHDAKIKLNPPLHFARKEKLYIR